MGKCYEKCYGFNFYGLICCCLPEFEIINTLSCSDKVLIIDEMLNSFSTYIKYSITAWLVLTCFSKIVADNGCRGLPKFVKTNSMH